MAMPCENLPSVCIRNYEADFSFFVDGCDPTVLLKLIAEKLITPSQDYRSGKLAVGLIETGTPCGLSRVMSGILILAVSTVTVLVTVLGLIDLAISKKLLIAPHL
jgi:hypothetical protein